MRQQDVLRIALLGLRCWSSIQLKSQLMRAGDEGA
jgi:hypothetical protein